MIEYLPGLWRSPLPRARDLATFAERGGRAVVDLTQRPRDVVARACERHGLTYIKHPLPYQGGDFVAAARAVIAAERPSLVHCFHGRDRTGVVVRLVTMLLAGRVVLYRCGRNLNRAYRTCEAFGVPRLSLVDCDARLSGPLFKASGRVSMEAVEHLPEGTGVVALETWAKPSIHDIDWSAVHTLVLGGESHDLPRRLDVQWARIPMLGQVSGLTVEGALAVALGKWSAPWD